MQKNLEVTNKIWITFNALSLTISARSIPKFLPEKETCI